MLLACSWVMISLVTPTSQNDIMRDYPIWEHVGIIDSAITSGLSGTSFSPVWDVVLYSLARHSVLSPRGIIVYW